MDISWYWVGIVFFTFRSILSRRKGNMRNGTKHGIEMGISFSPQANHWEGFPFLLLILFRFMILLFFYV
ncbi:hypothetical protein BDZ91DRAFT_307849 [Kalaharituber pfeilii]|nr:hypothetical protein BDZ91DRAFT_307849 [Kalaharituber pfeilii]